MLPILLLTLAAPIVPGQPIAPEVPWAIAPDDGPRTLLEEATGRRIDPRTIAPVREGDMVFTAESMAVGILDEMGEPLPALDHPPTPGILILAMDGVSLKKTCGGPQQANAALNCTPLVDGPTDFPAAGNDQTKASVLQAMKNFYADFNLVISTARPPDFVPYTLSVIGGTSGNAGQDNGICGVANVACDGAKRNHVSLTFSASCPGDIALTAGQETAHNWGLEHTDVESDIMYPFVVGAGKFENFCMPISHATGSGITQCSYVHELYCPDGQGEQQNSYGELMGVFGARAEDTTPPTIVSVVPADGSVFNPSDEITVSAELTDDSNFVGVKWTWIDGVPAELGDSYTRCTNEVCDDDFSSWKLPDGNWEFVTFAGAPVGHYAFKVEVMDAYGHYVSQSVAFDIVEGGEPTASAGDESSSSADPSGDPDATGDADSAPTSSAEDTGTPTDGSDPSGAGSMTGITGFTGADGTDTADMDGDDGCGCRSPGSSPVSLVLLLGLAARRRRR